MPGKVKTLDNMSKNMTKEERDARAQAEGETLPVRDQVRLIPPKYINRDKAARKYWRDTLERMKGITLLDDLDTEILALYCSQLSRRDALNELYRKSMDDARTEKLKTDKYLEVVGKLDSLIGKLQLHEKTLLTYAEKLGLTPSGRVHLARKRAEAREVDEADDLFGN